MLDAQKQIHTMALATIKRPTHPGSVTASGSSDILSIG